MHMFTIRLALVSPSHEDIYSCLARVKTHASKEGVKLVEGRPGWLMYTCNSCLVVIHHPSTARLPMGLPAQYRSLIRLECTAASDAVDCVGELVNIVKECHMVSLVPET
jgi:hypothetical protein